MKNSVMRYIGAVMLMCVAALAAKAQTITIPMVEIQPGQQKTVEVMLDNDVPVNTLQFDMLLPDGLEMVGDFQRTDRLPAKMVVKTNQKLANNAQNKRVLTVPSDLTETIAPGAGAVLKFTLRAKDNVFATTETPLIQVSRISYTINTTQGVKQPDFAVSVVAQKPVVDLSATPASIALAPGQTREVTFALTNSVTCSMLEFVLNLPEGLQIADGDYYSYGDRVNPTAMLMKSANSGSIKFILAVNPTSTTLVGMDGNEGDFLTLKLTATDALPKTSAISVSNVIMSNIEGSAIKGTSLVDVKVVSSVEAKAKADAQVAAIQAALDAAIKTIVSECPNVKDDFTGEAIQIMIDALKSAINDAYADGSIVDNYATIMAPVADITAATEALLADAKAAQKAYEDEVARQQANQAAYDADLQAIATLQAQLDAAKQKVAAECPNADVAAQVAEVQSTLDLAKSKADAGYKAVETEGTYASVVNQEAVSAAIAKILTDAQAQQAEYNRTTANKAAYDADMAKIKELQGNLEATVANIQATYPGCDDPQANLAVKNAIEAAKEAVENAYKAVATEGTYTSPLNAEALQTQIDTLLKNAKLKSDENARQAANKAAYDADMAAIAQLEANLKNAEEKIAADYPAYTDKTLVEAAKGAIATAKTGVENAYKAVATEGIYTSPLDAEALQAQIDAILTAAKAAQEAADKAEADRQAANKAAYDADMAKILELRSYLNTVWAQISQDYTGYGDAVAKAACENAINAAEAAVKKAYEDVAAAGTYESPLNYDELRADIDALLTNAKAAADEATRVEANKAAYDADLAKVDDLQKALDEAIAEIKEKYAAGEDLEAEKALQDKIDAAEAAVKEAYEDVAAAGTYESPLNYETLKADIDALVTDAKAAAEEAARVEANEEAYNADLTKVEELQKALDEAIAEIKEKYAEGENPDAEKALQDKIDAMMDAIKAELDDVAEEGNYQSPLTDGQIDAIKDEIQAMVEEAQKSGILSIYFDEADGPVEIYTLDGIRHEQPVSGQVNIFRSATGKTTKVRIR